MTYADDIDTQVRVLAEMVRTGAIEELQARWRIAAMLLASPMIAEEIARSGAWSSHLRADLEDRCRDHILRRCTGQRIGTQHGPQGAILDLDVVAAGRSACAWVRTGLQFGLRGRWHRDIRNQAPLMGGLALDAPVGTDSTRPAMLHEMLAAPRSDVALHAEDEQADLARARFLEHAARAPESSLVFHRRDAIVQGLGVTDMLRPLHAHTRAMLADLLAGAPQDAVRTAVRDGGTPLEVLWEHWGDTERDRVAYGHPHIAHTLAEAALSPLPRPAAAGVAAFRRAVSRALVARGLDLASAAALPDAFLAAEFAARSGRDRTTRQVEGPPVPVTDWPDLLPHLGGDLASRDPHEVRTWLLGMLPVTTGAGVYPPHGWQANSEAA